MTYFTILLLIKITVSILLVALPFLLFSKQRLEKITSSKHDSLLFFRLYGVAITALLVAYASAIPLAQSGIFPWGIAIMGLVSNAGASTLLFTLGKGKQSLVLAMLFGFIAISLVLAMLVPVTAVSNIY